jgi:glutathione S-transferase
MLAIPSMLVTAGVTVLAVIFYTVTAIRAGTMRERHNIAAPAVTGHPEFERAYRVQMNTLEAMPVFLPALWIAAYYFTKVPLLAPAIGLVWIVGRIVYMQAYMADPSRRSLGFTISALSQIALLLLAIAGLVMSWSGITSA